MKSHTYYDVLGVSRDATLEEITTAKNALAKVYHPDANVHKDIDTTEQMQNILEAYRVLSDPEKRKAYNREMFGETDRVFRTFTVGPENDGEEEAVSFVTYWNTANRLHEVIGKSVRLMKHEDKKKSLPQRIFRKIGKNQKHEESMRSLISTMERPLDPAMQSSWYHGRSFQSVSDSTDRLLYPVRMRRHLSVYQSKTRAGALP